MNDLQQSPTACARISDDWELIARERQKQARAASATFGENAFETQSLLLKANTAKRRAHQWASVTHPASKTTH
jgi:hypothetical protein